MYRILLVEDDKNIQELIANYFTKKEADTFQVDIAANGQAGLDKAYENHYDLLLLDVMLPEMDGFAICREIRRDNDVPIMFITARADETDILKGYSLGCDDYVIKPFPLPVLYQKVNALIKRSKGLVRSKVFTVGSLSLNPNNGKVISSGEEIKLTAREYAILKVLIENKGAVIHTNVLLFQDYLDHHLESQIILTNAESGQTVADTAYKIAVECSLANEKGKYPDVYGYLDYHTIRNMLSNPQYRTIEQWLNTEHNDGKTYELVFTKFCFRRYEEIIPLELSVVLMDKSAAYDTTDEIVATITLPDNTLPEEDIYFCGDRHLNIIPRDFLLNGAYHRDYISTLSDEQRESSVKAISTAPLEYIFYTTDYLYLTCFTLEEMATDGGTKETYSLNNTLFYLQYAKKINLLDQCGTDLAVGAAILFGFFLVIALILCLMTWKIVKVQILQEKKRADITNALAHDIKTPLFVISGYAYSLKENIDVSERDHYLERIIEQTDEINSLVHKMLNLSKLDSYKVTLNRTDFDLVELVKEIQRDFTVLPDSKTILLTYTGSCPVYADRELLKTAVQNLIDNAVKYALPGSDIQIDITDKTLTIANQGEPLTKTELKQIWPPYIRKDKSRSQKGNGLGLSIVKSILDLHGIRYNLHMKDAATVEFCAVWKNGANRPINQSHFSKEERS